MLDMDFKYFVFQNFKCTINRRQVPLSQLLKAYRNDFLCSMHLDVDKGYFPSHSYWNICGKQIMQAKFLIRNPVKEILPFSILSKEKGSV